MARRAALLALPAAAAAGGGGAGCDTPLRTDEACHHSASGFANTSSADGCCAACAADPACDAWDWASPGAAAPPPRAAGARGNCRLYAVCPKTAAAAGYVCGVKAPTPAPTPVPPPAPAGSPNIIWVLTDDQDQKLGGSFPQVDGVGPMPKTQRRLVEEGATAENWFIHTPICCPSRSELVTGRYFHNLKQLNGGCMHINETLVKNQTFALYLQRRGYTVGMFGKFLNQNPAHPPAGIDAYMTNGGGQYFAPQFDTKGVSDLAPYHMPDGGWHGDDETYTTAVVGNVSLSWLRKVAKGDQPFMAYVAPKACHEPFTPAAWYAGHWAPGWPAAEPRPASWNCSAESRANHHGNVATQPMITPRCAEYITNSFKNRWRTLMSVDDVIDGLVDLVEGAGLFDRTYFFYSSDHGFQLGEFNILIDKRQMYDHDIRIHLIVRGPGIKPGSTFPYLGTNVDIAPTWLGLAGADRPESMDGRSVAPLLIDAGDPAVPRQTREHIARLAPDGRAAFAARWRDSAFIEYYFCADNVKCGDYPTEDVHNNFIGLRHMAGSEFGDTSYAEYQTGDQRNTNIGFDAVDFVEYFNITADSWQMDNLWKKEGAGQAAQARLHDKLQQWFSCRGDSCP